jgi:hypothetical protein
MREVYTRRFSAFVFTMREVLVSCREKWKFVIADFHVLGIFMAKNMIWAKKNFRLTRAGAVAVERKICDTPTA